MIRGFNEAKTVFHGEKDCILKLSPIPTALSHKKYWKREGEVTFPTDSFFTEEL